MPSWSTRTPLWAYWGNRPRAGKDYCATIPNILLDGFACEQQPIGKDSAETSKRIMAANLAGAQILHFSNQQGYLDDPALTQAITALFISGRQLGSNSASAHQGVPNLADYSISLNVGSTCREDIVARSRQIELAFYAEDPNSRTFPRPDLHGWIAENRSRIISAIFALFKHWAEKGCPEGPTPFTSFPDWSRIVGGVMAACGLGDPCLPFKAEYESVDRDTRTEAMTELYKVCYASHPGQWIVNRSLRLRP